MIQYLNVVSLYCSYLSCLLYRVLGLNESCKNCNPKLPSARLLLSSGLSFLFLVCISYFFASLLTDKINPIPFVWEGCSIMLHPTGIWYFLSRADFEKVIHAFISSCFDYCNSLYSGLCHTTIFYSFS